MLIEEYIGYSKLTFLDTSNKLYIYNEDKGEWFEGVWFSNTGHKEYKKIEPIPVKKQELTPYKPEALYSSNFNDRRKSHVYLQCEYCMCYKPGGKTYDNIGYLCDECIQELKDLDIKIEGSLDNLVSQLLGTKDKKKAKIEEDESRWLDWDTYYGRFRGDY